MKKKNKKRKKIVYSKKESKRKPVRSKKKETKRKKRYLKKKVKIKKNEVDYSPYLVDLRKEGDKEPIIIRKERIIRHAAPKGYFDIELDFLKARGKFIIPADLKEEKVADEIIQKEEIPLFLKKIANSQGNLPKKVNNFFEFFDQRPFLRQLKTFIAFAFICFILVIPVRAATLPKKIEAMKIDIVKSSSLAYKHFQKAENNLENYQFELARKEFSLAKKGFIEAQNKIGPWKIFVPAIAHFSQKASSYYLLKAGENLSSAGEILSEEVIDWQENLDFKGKNPEICPLGFTKLIKSLDIFQDKGRKILRNLNQAQSYLDKVDNTILSPEDKEKLKIAREKFEKVFTFLKIIPDILGKKEIRHYVFLFQNNNEIRPTGGFIGSLALVTIDQGEVKHIVVPPGGPYDFRESFLENIKAPQPLTRVNPKWEMQDANWWPDFPTSAKKFIWFYERSGGPTTDGVIAFNADLIPQLLELVGPIEMPSYQKIITADNFIEETQKAVELEYDREKNNPKEFIADLFYHLLEKTSQKLKGKDKIDFSLKLIKILNDAFSQREIQVYFTDKKVEKEILQLGIGGEIKGATKDYLMVVNTNIGGGKTDGVIKQERKLIIKVQKDGSIINELTLKRTHLGKKEDYFTGKRNNDYLRIYLPKGSVLLENKGFTPPGPGNFALPDKTLKEDKTLLQIEKKVYFNRQGTKIYTAFNKSVFANWLEVNPGESREVVIKYKLPFKFDNRYSLFIQKQAGDRNIKFEANLILPDGKIYKFKSDLKKDEYWSPLEE